MNIDFIRELADILNEAGLTELDYREESGEIRLSRTPVAKKTEKNFVYQNNTLKEQEIINKEKSESGKTDTGKNEKQDFEYIKSNIIGTFYSKPSPDERAFVDKGTKVKEGQVVCIIESMKLMNEIKAPFDCIIEDILVSDQEIVEFGQPLFSVSKGGI